jgi:hypothetical protein
LHTNLVGLGQDMLADGQDTQACILLQRRVSYC